MQFNPYNVVLLLYTTFTAMNIPQIPITPEEQEVKSKIESMLQDLSDETLYVIEQENSLEFENPNRISITQEEDVVDLIDFVETEGDCPKNADFWVSPDYKRRAIEFWKGGITRPRTLESVKRRYKKVSSLRQLRRWEKQLEKGGTSAEKLRRIGQHILNNFNAALAKGIIIHDIDIARWASQTQDTEKVPGFKASQSWITRFKKTHHIVSRKITKFVTKKNMLSKPELETKTKAFVENVKLIL